MRPDIVPGATFPDYELPDENGVRFRLSALQGDDPMVLHLSRGEHCPRERQMHRELVVDRIYCGYWFRRRPSIYDLWADLRDVYRRIRPDFDPLVPAARYEWFAMQRMSTSGSFGDADHDDALPLRRAVRAPGTKRILERAFGASRPLGDMAADDDTLSFLREGLTTTGLSKILWAGGQLAW